MRLYGTVTSPYVRRIRVLGSEIAEPIEMVDTTTPEGQRELRARSPLGLVPIAEIDGRVVLDSRVIVSALLRARGRGPLRAEEADDETLLTVADGALDSLINVFYLVNRDGADPALPYLARQRERAEEALRWLGARLHGPSFSATGGLGVPELALTTALGWMRFRKVLDVDAAPALAAFSAAWEARPSFAATRPG
jgi:glutathione S-transferase